MNLETEIEQYMRIEAAIEKEREKKGSRKKVAAFIDRFADPDTSYTYKAPTGYEEAMRVTERTVKNGALISKVMDVFGQDQIFAMLAIRTLYQDLPNYANLADSERGKIANWLKGCTIALEIAQYLTDIDTSVAALEPAMSRISGASNFDELIESLKHD